MGKKTTGLRHLIVILKLALLSIFLMVSTSNAGPIEDLEAFLQSQYGMSLADLQIPNLNITYGNNLSMTCSVEFDLLAKAEPDECYFGPCNSSPVGAPGCTSDSANKVNQAYVWGMTMDGNGKIWFGTVPNTHCLVLSGYLGIGTGFETDSYTCGLGDCTDFRPPEIYSYDPSAPVNQRLVQHLNTLPPHPLLQSTLGIRSAGAANGVIFLAGPALIGGGVNIFAFANNGAFLGAGNLNDSIAPLISTNIRKWLLAEDGNLYTTIGTTSGGRVLKWTGDADDPFQFEVVGELDNGSGAELAYHDGRIFVSTWPGGQDEEFDFAGLFMSPTVGDGLDGDDADGWIKVWEVTDYEPDIITAGTYGGGALASFEGQLYWGTMHVPLLSFRAYYGTDFYYEGNSGFLNSDEALEALLGSYRAISIFRGDNFTENDEQIELLYGMPVLPAVTSSPEPGSYIWEFVPNNMNGAIPRFGPSGFGNMFNNYTWSMQVFGDKLWIGTMDWSYIIGDLTAEVLQQFAANQPGFQIPELPETLTNLPTYFYGADLFCITGSNAPALPLCLSGLGNYTNYGIRNMVADENNIYFGMANPMNLLTDETDEQPEGGWELLSRGDLEIDGDLVSEDIEKLAPNNGDGNGDGIPDSEQPHVASIRPNDSQNFITLEVLEGDCNQIRGIMPIPNDFLPPDEDYYHPYGNLYLMLQCPPQAGESTTIRIYYHGVNSVYNLIYRKFGQMAPQTPPVWFTYPNAVFGVTTVNGEGVAYADLTLSDNALGDFFLHNNSNDGFIIDPGGPARARSMAIPTLSEWGIMVTMILLVLTGIIYMRKHRLSAFE